jgi:hypothetical protein
MSELHWTGAAVLLALAVLSYPTARPRRAMIVSWEDFARERGLAPEHRPATGEPAIPRRRARS